MIKKKMHSAITLHKLIQKICNDLISIVQEDVIRNLVESLCNYILVKGNGYDFLSKHMEAAKQRHSGLELASTKVRD